MYTIFFFFNDTATTEIYTLSLHDALPIFPPRETAGNIDIKQISPGTTVLLPVYAEGGLVSTGDIHYAQDRKSTRLNSSHANISYAVFCLKKKKHPLATHRPIYLIYLYLRS